MLPVRVLVVDDSALIRRVVRETLDGDPDIEVVATAPNGKIAVDKVVAVSPDVVVLDIEMPVMTGIEALPLIRAHAPHLPVIMFSTLTTRGGRSTLDALAAGATDYVTKPGNTGCIEESIEQIRRELAPRVKALGGGLTRPVPRGVLPDRVDASPPARRSVSPTARARVEAVVLGVSTGGPKALSEVVPRLPADLPVPVLVVQHMPPLFTKALADRLDGLSPLHVREAAAGDTVEAGVVLIAPGDRHLVVDRCAHDVVARLTDDPPESSCRPAADPLFRSASRVWGPGVLAVVMTGMGHDGCVGAGVVRENGGSVVVQDEATSVVWGMPGFVARAGLADAVVPLDEIAAEIAHRVARNRSSDPRAVVRRA